MAEYGDKGTRFLKGLLFGSILGFVAVSLLAPKSGRELKSKIQEKGSKILKNVEETSEEAKGVIDDIQHHAGELIKDLVKIRRMTKRVFAIGEKKGALRE